jgi:hypothetical protein
MKAKQFTRMVGLSCVFLFLILLLPVSGVTGSEPPAGAGAQPVEVDGQDIYYSKDVARSCIPDAEQYEEAIKKVVPEQFLPDALKEKPRTSESNEAGAVDASAVDSGAGTGGWTGFERAYTPSSDPNTAYRVDTSEGSNVFGADGTRHCIYGVATTTDISEAPDAAGFYVTSLVKHYYTAYSEGAFSTPVSLTPISGHQSADPLLFEMDQDGYLHLVYTKWTWDRDPSKPAGDYSAYQHEGQNVYYRYRSPDGTWSAAKKLTNNSGAWQMGFGNFQMHEGRIYGMWLQTFNKETVPQTFRSRYSFIDGVRESWSDLKTLRQWDYSNDPGELTPWYFPTFDVSPLNGEVTAIYTLLLRAVAPKDFKTRVYAHMRDSAGEWASHTVTQGTANRWWMLFDVLYDTDSMRCTLFGGIMSWVIDPTNEPFGNYYLIRHEGNDWEDPLNLTRAPSKQVSQFLSAFIDQWNRWNLVYSVEKAALVGGFWTSQGSSIFQTAEEEGGLGDIETILPYHVGRWSAGFDATMDRNGDFHVLYETQTSSGGPGADQRVYYSDSTSGSYSSPKKLSVDSNQDITGLFVSVNPQIDTLATWAESKVSGGGTPQAGVIYSMYLAGGAWGPRVKVTEVPGSTDIMHVTLGGWPQYYDLRQDPLGQQQVVFETAKYNPGPGTYYGFKKYFTETVNGMWQTPQLLSSLGARGMGSVLVDANSRVHAVFEVVISNKDVLYSTMQPGATPPATTYYFAEGTTRAGFQEWLSLQNAGGEDANVDVTYMLGTGENKLQQVPVPAHSRVTVDVNLFVGPEQDVSALVRADRLIVAERPMYFDYMGWAGGHDAIGSTNTSRMWYFAEGTTRPGFQEYLTLQNPAEADTEVTITYMKGDGSTQEQQVAVPGKTRQTVDVNAAVGPNEDVSMKVESPRVAIVAERPMYFNYGGAWDGGHNAVGSQNLAHRWYFAEGTTRSGFDTYICLQNPGPVDGSATITYILGNGSTKTSTIELPGTARQTLKVNDVIGAEQDVSLVVDASTLILAERPMYFDYHGFARGGHVAVGGLEPKNSWFFAEGTTRPGFEEWLSLENPTGQDATALISYMMGDGSTQTQNVPLPAHTRVTVDVPLAVGGDKDVSVAVWCDQGIIAERPMYFAGGDGKTWPGGSDVMGL